MKAEAVVVAAAAVVRSTCNGPQYGQQSMVEKKRGLSWVDKYGYVPFA